MRRQKANDVHGDAVNVAARITQVARARQVLATTAAVDALPPDLRHRARHIRRASIKGRQEQLDLFQIGWRADGGDTVHIVGEDTLLRDSGAILLGRPFAEGLAWIIEFSIHLAPTWA